MKYVLPLLFLFFAASSSGQGNPVIQVFGNVTDENEFPVFNAKVQDLKSLQTTTTNKSGIFSFTIEKTPTTLRFSADGYLTGEYKITDRLIKQSKNDTLLVLFQLKTKVQEIDPVEVIGKRSLRAYDRPEIAIIDYDLHEKGLLLLIREKRENKLRVVDELSATLCETSVPKLPERLFKDCFGNQHLIYEDSVYQIAEENGKIGLMAGISRANFDDFLESCMISTDTDLIFRTYGLHNQSLFYFSKSKKTKETTPLHESVDQTKTIAVQDQVEETQALIALGIDPMGEISVSELGVSRKIKQNQWFYKFVLSRPLYSPIFDLHDSLFILDHIRDSIFVYTKSGKLSRASAIPIEYHLQPGWNREVIVDQTTKKTFAKFSIGGVTQVREIDLNTGQLTSNYLINKHPFPEKIKLRDGYLYYLYTELYDMSVPNIYRQKLD